MVDSVQTPPTGDMSSDWYKPGKSLTEFHESEAFVRAIIGGRGSGKTSSVAMDSIKHGFHNPGSKILCLRKTQISQMDTSVDTFNRTYNSLGALYQQTSTSLFQKWGGGLTVRLPSLAAIDAYNVYLASGNRSKQDIELWLQTEGEKLCSYLEFRGLPDAGKSGNKLRGFECSMAVLIEADMLTRNDYELVIPCLRWKNTFGQEIKDKGIIIDTNPPGPKHWIAQLEEETKDDPTFKFWHIPTEENSHNLERGYIDRLKAALRKNPAMYRRMVLGEYAEAFDGTPVYYAYDQDQHVFEDLSWPKGAYLVRSWDFGTSWAVIYSAYFSTGGQEYWWVLKEQFEEASDIDRQCRGVLKCTALNFPFWNNRTICQGVLDYCDPAGKAKTALGSVLTTLGTYGVYPGFRTKKRGIGPTVAVCNRLMESRDANGNLIFRVDRIHAPMLHDGFIGGYRYPKEGEAGYKYGKDSDPVKDGKYDHLCDAFRYGIINTMRLAKMDVESNNPTVGPLARKINLNPPRRDY